MREHMMNPTLWRWRSDSLGIPGHTGEVARGNTNSSFADLTIIETDKHELDINAMLGSNPYKNLI